MRGLAAMAAVALAALGAPVVAQDGAALDGETYWIDLREADPMVCSEFEEARVGAAMCLDTRSARHNGIEMILLPVYGEGWTRMFVRGPWLDVEEMGCGIVWFSDQTLNAGPETLATWLAIPTAEGLVAYDFTAGYLRRTILAGEGGC